MWQVMREAGKDVINDLKLSWKENIDAIMLARFPVSKKTMLAITGFVLIILVAYTCLVPQSSASPDKHFDNGYMSFNYYDNWHVIKQVDNPQMVKLENSRGYIYIQLMDQETSRIHQQNLVNAEFNDKGSIMLRDISVHQYNNNYLSTGQDFTFYYFNKGDRYYEIKGSNNYETGNLIEKIIAEVQ